MKKQILLVASFALLCSAMQAQFQMPKKFDYTGNEAEKHAVDKVEANFKDGQKPQNVILFIGDGMGTTQVFSGLTANNGQLYITQMPNVGFSLTQSADNYVTDSAAGGTALATGKRTRNNMVAIAPDSTTITPSMLSLCKKQKDMATGVLATSSVVHATPASFVCHNITRNAYQELALDYLNGEVDFFLGGGQQFFKNRPDGRDLYKEMSDKGYRIYEEFSAGADDKAMKQGYLLAPEHLNVAEYRPFSQGQTVEKAISVLEQNKKGFFMMVEGSQIDWGGHYSDFPKIVRELLDMDTAVGVAMKYAAEHKNTLVVVTADHETGGVSVLKGDMAKGDMKSAYTTGDHTAVMVPVFAFGPGAENFRGVYQNVEVFNKIAQLLDIKH